MTFEEYLTDKKIDRGAFKSAEPDCWKEWSALFEQMSEVSFTSQKLYLINAVRRKYLLKTIETATVHKQTAPAARPVMKPKPKIN
jgi:hypothetical protein